MRSLNRFINKSSLQSLTLKIPKYSRSELDDSHHVPEDPDTSLTQSEIDMISAQPFVQALPPHNSSRPIEYSPKVQNIMKYIPTNAEGDLTYHRPSNIPTPFQVYTAPRKDMDDDEQPGSHGHSGTPVSGFPRLSVTKLLTKSWCELRAWYEIYSLETVEETDAMRRGKESHLQLELRTHPAVDMSFVEYAIPQVEVLERKVELVKEIIGGLSEEQRRRVFDEVDDINIFDRFKSIEQDLNQTSDFITRDQLRQDMIDYESEHEIQSTGANDQKRDESSRESKILQKSNIPIDKQLYNKIKLSNVQEIYNRLIPILEESSPTTLETMIETLEIPPIKTKADVYAESILETINRLVTLLTKGRAREIYIHGFVDEDGIVTSRPSRIDDKMIVTGVIDHLVLLSNDSSRPLEKALERNLSECGDLKEFITIGEDVVKRYNEKYKLMISDVKTRSRRIIPSQRSVLKSAQDQVMIYKKFLDVMGTPGNGVEWLEEYCSRKGIDMDEPLSPEILLRLGYTYPLYLKDFTRLQKGEPLGDLQFDSYEIAHPYDLTYLQDYIKDEEVLQVIGGLLTKWEKAPTTRYFIIRASHIFQMVAQLSSDDLQVEYVQGTEAFEVKRFKYDEVETNRVVMEGLGLWQGRDPEPVEPTFGNLQNICKYCEFQQICSWNKKMKK